MGSHLATLFLWYNYFKDGQCIGNKLASVGKMAEKLTDISPSPILLRFHRKLAGFTLKKVSELIGKDPKNISDHENGKVRPNVTSLAQYAKAYKCDIDDFYDVDTGIVKRLGTGVVVNYFNDPEYPKDKKASIAAQLIISLPHQHEVSVVVSKAEEQVNELLDEGDTPEYKKQG